MRPSCQKWFCDTDQSLQRSGLQIPYPQNKNCIRQSADDLWFVDHQPILMVSKLFTILDGSVTCKALSPAPLSDGHCTPLQILGPLAVTPPATVPDTVSAPRAFLEPHLQLLWAPSNGQGLPLTAEGSCQKQGGTSARKLTPWEQPSASNDGSWCIRIRASLPRLRNCSEKRTPFPRAPPVEFCSTCLHW